jgi:beta-mannosidase
VAPSTPDLERLGGDPDLDDSDWSRVPVPGHWADVPELAASKGPVLYRHRFRADAPGDGSRCWLILEGVLDQGDVWLDGSYLGDTEGYFVPHRFDVTRHVSERQDHLLAIGVTCPPPGTGRSKRALTGSLQTGPLAPAGMTGGLWRPVHLEVTGPVAVRHSRLVCKTATRARAELAMRLVVDAASVTDTTLETTVTAPDGRVVARAEDRRPLAAGENRLEWTTTVHRPRLWWPAALGDQPLYRVEVRILVGGAVSDRHQWSTGLRAVAFDDFECRVNGQRLFCKGIAIGPQSARLGSLEPEVIAGDVVAARDAGFDLVRVHGHIGRPELYEAADRAGVLIWQDLPLVGGYSLGTRSQARRQTRAAVDLLGHHPSVALWCAHDEPNGPVVPVPVPERTGSSTPAVVQQVARHLLPSWNRSALDPLLRRELRSGDRSRTVVPSSGSLPHPPRLSGTDSHLWLGWRAGRARDLPRVLRAWPRIGRFVSSIGAQSVAVGEHPDGPNDLPGAEEGSFERYLPRSAAADGPSWSAASRTYQAAVVREHIEALRRLKYRPTGGFCVYALADADPGVGFGLLDAQRRAKPAYTAAVDACRPVIVVADPPPEVLTAGDHLDLALHVVSELRHRLDDVRLTARITIGGATTAIRGWAGSVEADSCTYVGRLQAEVPAVHGPMVVDLSLEGAGVVATNRYRATVIPPAEAVARSRSLSRR